MTDYAQRAPGVYVEQVPSGSVPIAGAGTSTAAFVGVVRQPESATDEEKARVELLTNYTEFKAAFGDLSKDRGDEGHSVLAHAVRGFFLNGGTRCYVTCVEPPATGTWKDAGITEALERFEPIKEISIVAAPGLSGGSQYAALQGHCVKMRTCVAILDTPETFGDTPFATALAENSTRLPPSSDHMALYFPWIQVHDPLSEETDEKKRRRHVPPSGHMAGIYARVDGQRGVHKAPANEVVLGALGLRYAVSQAHQDGLNAHGVNCIRSMNGGIKVWGARTIGGNANGEFKYVNVRRVFNYLRASIEQGTQWAVFEPNNADLWAKITRNVSAFLTTVWAAGALFGDKPEQAFYVKCDADTNPPRVRDVGMVVTEIGVAITRPAEFVVFRLGQKAAS